MSGHRCVLPSDLLRMALAGEMPQGPVAVDTETSGLHVDAGARISTVSVAFLDDDLGTWFQDAFGQEHAPDAEGRYQVATDSAIMTWAYERIDQWTEEPVLSFAWSFDQGVEGTGKPEDDGSHSLWSDTANLPDSEYEALLEWLQIVGKRTGLIMHHAKFDCHMFRAGVRRWPSLTVDLMPLVEWDTQNVADLLTSRFVTVPGADGPRPSSSLKPTADFLWGADSSDEQRVIKSYLAARKLPTGRWDLMPWSVIAKYADQDPRLTIRLFEWQKYQIAELQSRSSKTLEGWLDGESGRMTLEQAIARRLATSKMLFRTERRGLPFSVSAARAASAEITSRIEALERSLPFAPATLPNAKHFFFGTGVKRGVTGQERRPYGTTPSGDPQMDVAIVQKMVKDGLPHAETWMNIQKLQTAQSKWYDGWADRAGDDDRLRTSVRQNGTVSGRFSVENIQLQAIPHDYKLQNFEILKGIPSPRTLIDLGVPEGFRLWELDLANAELRVAALFAGCSRMLELIETGADLHADAATELFHMEPSNPRFGEFRQVAKRFNFSAIFGVGPKKLVVDIEQQTGIRFSLGETTELLRSWNALYPEFKRAIYSTMEHIDRRARANKGIGWVTMANGERRWFLPGEDTHKGFNQRVQGSLAQFGLDWWLSVEDAAMLMFGDDPHPKHGRPGVVLMVHDSTVLLVPDDSRGLTMVDRAVDLGLGLWRRRFPGVPGGVDASPWADHS